MSQPWQAEIDVTRALATSLIARQFPALSNLPVEPFSNGWDNTGFLVGGSWVFRFSRRHVAVPLLTCEIRCLPAMARCLPLAIPVPEYLGVPEASYPYHFAGYRLIPGRTACRARLDYAARMALAEPLAGFLRSLHAFAPATAVELGIPTDNMQRLDVTKRSPKALTLIDGLERRGDATATETHVLRAIVADAAGCRAPGTRTVVHGDLYVRHLIVDDGGRLAGVIDWGDLHLGDPAMDLMVAYMVLPPEGRQRFFSLYGEIDTDTQRLAQFRAALHLGYLCEYAHDIGDEALLIEMRHEIGHLVLDG